MADDIGEILKGINSDPAPAAQAAAPEPEPEPEVEKPPKLVPIQALDEARLETKALKDQLAQQTDKIGRMEQRFQDVMIRLAQPQQAQQPQAPRLPDQQEQPVEHFNARVGKLEQASAQDAQQRQQQATLQQVMGHFQMAEAEFVAKQADYPQALAFLRAQKLAEYQNHYAITDPMQRKAMLDNEEFTFGLNNLKMGKNPAEAAYQMAVARGYKAQGAASDSKTLTDAAKKVQQLAAGQMAENPAAGAGGAEDTTISLERIADLEGEAFERAFRQMIASQKPKTSMMFN